MKALLFETKLSFALFALCIFVAPNRAFAQQLTLHLERDQLAYANALDVFLDLWQKKKIIFLKSDLEEKFNVQLAGFMERQKASRIEKIIPRSFIEDNWKRMPGKLEATMPLSTGARLTLIGGIVDAAPELKKRGIMPTAESIREQLNFSLYVTLAAAQEAASRKHQEKVNAIDVRRGGIYFFSLGWPFCCAAR